MHVTIILFLVSFWAILGCSHADSQVFRDGGVTPVQSTVENSLMKEGVRTLLFADQVTYDEKNDRVMASGHVEVSRGEITVFADTIVYDQKLDQIVATGNVRLRDTKKNITFAHRLEISGDLKKGVAEAVQGIMADDSIYAANAIKRSGGVRNQFDQSVYTPCPLCRKDPNSTPTWQLKSRHMVWDEEQGDIHHADAHLEMWGVPVFYTPYLSHPGPTLKRRSGFLTPFFGASGNLGAIVGVPYFWAIGEDKDLTITPVYTRENPLLMLGYRHAFCKGNFDIEGSLTHSTYQKGPKGAEVNKKKWRGHIKSKARFGFQEGWYAGFDVQRAFDDTYLKKYRFLGLGHDSFLTSRVYTEKIWQRHYGVVEALSFQSLNQEDTTSKIPFVLPSADLNLLSQPVFLGGALYMDANLLNLQRRKGQNVKRLSTTVGWKRQWISALGLVSEGGLNTRVDAYRVTNLQMGRGETFSGQRYRVLPKAHALVKYPFFQNLRGGRVVIEPLVGGVVSANNRASTRIPNEDASLFELSDANILSPHRYAGLDRMDDGSRMTYGSKFVYYSTSVGNSELFLGQSHSLTDVPKDLAQSGVLERQSDYVVRANYLYKDWVDFTSLLLMNKKNLNAKRNDSSVNVGQPILKARVTYSRFPKITQPGIAIEQISYGATSQLTKQWSIQGDITRELGRKGGNLSHGGGVTFEDECFKFNTSVVKTFYSDRDYKPGVTVMFRLSFKNLGDVQISGDQLGLGQKAEAVNDGSSNNKDPRAVVP